MFNVLLCYLQVRKGGINRRLRRDGVGLAGEVAELLLTVVKVLNVDVLDDAASGCSITWESLCRKCVDNV